MFILELPSAVSVPPNLCVGRAAATSLLSFNSVPKGVGRTRGSRSPTNPSLGLPDKSVMVSWINDQGTVEPRAGSASPQCFSPGR